MKIFLIFTINSLFLFACASYSSIDKKQSNFSFTNYNKADVSSLTSNFFISGNEFNPPSTISNNNIKNINVTDSVYFYKIQGFEQYIRGTTNLWCYDISKNQPSLFAYELYDLEKFPEKVKSFIRHKKIENSKNINLNKIPPLKVTRYGMEFSNKTFNEKGSTKISYIINFETPRFNRSQILFESIVFDLLTKHPFVTDIIYIECYGKNFTVSNVKIADVYDARIYKSSNFDDLYWDFIEDKNNKYLVVRFKMISDPIGYVTQRAIRIKIEGIYSK